MIINYKDIVQVIIDGQDKATNRVMLKAFQKSSGKYKASALAKFGHPYSTRNVGGWVPYGDLGKINVQSGNFYLHWKKQSPFLRGDSIISAIYNDADYADQLATGKKSTQARPLIQGLLSTAEYWQRFHLVRSLKDGITRCNQTS